MANSMVKTIQLNADMKNFIQQFVDAIKGLQNETQKIEKPSIFDKDLKDSQDVLDQLREIKEAKDELERIGAKDGNSWKKLEEKEKDLKAKEGIKDPNGKLTIKENLTKTFSSVAKIGWGKIVAIGAKAFSKLTNIISGIFQDAINDIKDSLSYDSNGMNYSEEAYNQQIEYGLSDSENYALTKTLKRLNMSKDEYEMGGYNDERAKLLREQLEYNKKNYEELKNSGALKKMAQLQEDYQKAKEEMKQTIIKFIAEHGKEIMDIFRGLLNVLKSIFKVLNWIRNTIGNDGTQTAEEAREHTNQIIQSNMVTTSNKTNNININNSLIHNGAGTTTRSQLIEAGKQNGMIIQNSIKNS